MRSHAAAAAATVLLTAACGGGSSGAPLERAHGPMLLATTTSTQDTGLLDVLLPQFEQGSDCVAKPIATGSGQAMAMGESGDVDVLLVHSPTAELEFMAAGHGSSREPVMHNDFVLVGPPDDPAGASGAVDAVEAVELITAARQPFASRADDSGTHAKELHLWRRAGIDPEGDRYVRTGQGMAQTLTIADQKDAYTLTDRGTYLAMVRLGSAIVFEGSTDLRNPYHVIVVDGDGTNVGCAEEFSRWIRSEPAQRAIAEFGVDRLREPLFFTDGAY